MLRSISRASSRTADTAGGLAKLLLPEGVDAPRWVFGGLLGHKHGLVALLGMAGHLGEAARQRDT
jgi:hypothetical protein